MKFTITMAGGRTSVAELNSTPEQFLKLIEEHLKKHKFIFDGNCALNPYTILLVEWEEE